ncbi:MAG: 6-phosphogluconolactonase [Mariniblastus sp.]
MNPSIKTFADNPAVANAFAKDFVELLKTLTSSQAKVTVALSGGSTPKLLYSILAEEFSEAVDWSRVHFFWGDERCVPPTDEQSNYGEADTLFLSKIKMPESNVHRIWGENVPVIERERYEHVVVTHVAPGSDSVPSFDIMLLGMGGDGHTASIFPHEIEFLKSGNICEVATHPESGQNRITLTGKILNASKHVFFLVTGSGKAEVLAEIFGKTGKFETYPTTHIAPAIEPTFYIDEAAAAKL